MMVDDSQELFGQPDQPIGVVVVFGGQAGSEGKGAIVGYLARKYKWGAAICTFMSNAGHTWMDDDDSKVVVSQIPMALVADVEHIPLLLIGPGSAITPEILERELNKYACYNVADRLRIDPRAMIIEEMDRLVEGKATKHIASTMKGCGSALSRKVMRGSTVQLARDIPWMEAFIAPTVDLANDVVNRGGGLLVEGSQGFDLDINHGVAYPYCTSRGTTPMQTLADCGVDGRLVSKSIAVVRSYPIRVGHVIEDGVRVGDSGPYGTREVSFEQLVEMMVDADLDRWKGNSTAR